MQNTLLILVFIIGYSAIVTEHKIRVNKAASALIAGALTWTILILFSTTNDLVNEALKTNMSDIAGMLFFLMGAMTIVELIDSHDGFDLITQRIKTKSNRKLLWIISLTTFFLSAVLDNLTTTILMVSLTRKLIKNEQHRWLYTGTIIIAANAGGAWSPMGDVTTTMLWIGQQISPMNIIFKLFIPSLINLLIPLTIINFLIKPGKIAQYSGSIKNPNDINLFEKNLIFLSGMLSLLFVPFFKAITGLPPFTGMLLALGFMWGLTEILHRRKHVEKKDPLSVVNALRKIDTSTILFFLGILLCISALKSSGILLLCSNYLTSTLPNQSTAILTIGLFSAIVDNVPLVAAVQGMYPLSAFPTDHFLWEFIAYATGTGGSILIIGSAAGIAAMGLEKITFYWYLKRISLIALTGYLAGGFAYIIMF